MVVTLQEHNLAWAIEFSRVHGDLLLILKDIPLHSIRHVGSTSIPGLIAKPVLDIDSIIPRCDLPLVCTALNTAGYTSIDECGVKDRLAFRQPGFNLNASDGSQNVRDDNGKVEMRRNVYVVIEGCLALRNHLALKRVLSENKVLRNEYAQVKGRVAQEVDTNLEYCKRKTDVILKVLKATGLSEDEPDEVRQVNV